MNVTKKKSDFEFFGVFGDLELWQETIYGGAEIASMKEHWDEWHEEKIWFWTLRQFWTPTGDGFWRACDNQNEIKICTMFFYSVAAGVIWLWEYCFYLPETISCQGELVSQRRDLILGSSECLAILPTAEDSYWKVCGSLNEITLLSEYVQRFSIV